MCLFLEIPFELRELIIEHVLYTPLSPPVTPLQSDGIESTILGTRHGLEEVAKSITSSRTWLSLQAVCLFFSQIIKFHPRLGRSLDA